MAIVVDGSRLNNTDELELQDYHLENFFQEHMPPSHQLIKSTICSVPSQNHYPRSCLVQVFGPRKLTDSLDDTSIIDFMFPEHKDSCTGTNTFCNETGWRFAEANNWLSPSMAVYTKNYAYPVHWLSRVSLYNPLHQHDYLLTIVLKF